MTLFSDPFGFFFQYWWVATLAFLLLAAGVLRWIKAHPLEYIQALCLAIAFFVIVPTVGAAMAMSASDPRALWGWDVGQDFFAALGDRRDFGVAWFTSFRGIMAGATIMLTAGVAFVLGIKASIMADESSLERRRR